MSTTRGTTQFTLVTAHHDQIPPQPYGDFLGIFGEFFLTVQGHGSHMDTEIDVKEQPNVQPEKCAKEQVSSLQTSTDVCSLDHHQVPWFGSVSRDRIQLLVWGLAVVSDALDKPKFPW